MPRPVKGLWLPPGGCPDRPCEEPTSEPWGLAGPDDTGGEDPKMDCGTGDGAWCRGGTANLGPKWCGIQANFQYSSAS